MKLNLQSLNRRAEWEALGVRLPEYDVAAMAERTRRAPIWAHFGAGNLFRGYVAMLQQSLLNHGLADRGVIAVDTSADGELTRRVYLPHDNLTLRIALRGDGSTDAEIAAAVAEAVRADFSDADCLCRLREIFRSPSLQMVSFTITEKGYALRAADGKLLPDVEADLKNEPDRAANVMAKAAALLLERFRAGALPVAMVSMDNCSRNGEKLRDAVRFIARGWIENGFAPAEFADYLADETRVSFPWTMIDKIVPRPDAEIARRLAERGIEGMEILPRARGAAVAPFVNAETAEYLVVEDSFPAGRPPLERAGVRMTDRATVSLCERMKVTACLNPLHTALAVLGCALGDRRISDEMGDPALRALAERIGAEGLRTVVHPGILDPEAFLRELLTERLPNPSIPDTPQRIACDTSQKVPIRYGETLKAYVAAGIPPETLTGIPLAIAGWMRYLLGVDDALSPFEPSPDPRLAELQRALSGVEVGKPETYRGQLRPLLADETLFGLNLSNTALAEKIEHYFISMLAGRGAIRQTLERALKEE